MPLQVLRLILWHSSQQKDKLTLRYGIQLGKRRQEADLIVSITLVPTALWSCLMWLQWSHTRMCQSGSKISWKLVEIFQFAYVETRLMMRTESYSKMISNSTKRKALTTSMSQLRTTSTLKCHLLLFSEHLPGKLYILK